MDECSGSPTGQLEPVTPALAQLYGLSFARSGKRAVYSQLVERSNIERVEFDPVSEAASHSHAVLTNKSTLVDLPNVSPDGQHLVVRRDIGGYSNLWIINPDGTGLRQLTSDNAHVEWPRWSPDSKSIAFRSDRGGGFQIWIIRLDGGGLEQVTNLGQVSAFGPAWSPDGRNLTYFVHNQGTFILDTHKPWRQQEPRALLPIGPANDTFLGLAWSPDSRTILGMNLKYVNFVFDLASGRYRQVAQAAKFSKWLGDSRRILYIWNDRLWLTDTVSGRSKMILALDSAYLSSFSITRDDRAIYYDRQTDESDIWAMDWK